MLIKRVTVGATLSGAGDRHRGLLINYLSYLFLIVTTLWLAMVMTQCHTT